MRYIRQEILKELGKESQDKLLKSTVTIIGIGAIGTKVLDILARAGIGKIRIIDRDIVEINNLQRQNLFDEEDLGKPKVAAAKEKIAKINSEIVIEEKLIDLDYDNTSLLNSNLILDCTDNIYTRFLINEYARKNQIPWIYASVIGTKGMTLNITPKTPCFSCIFEEPTEPLDTCDTAGVINTIPHLIAAIQATEAIKILTNKEYSKDLIHYDLWNNEITKIKVKKSKKCNVCNGVYHYLNGKKSNGEVKVCGSCNYQIKIDNIDMASLFEKLSKLNNIKTNDDCLILNDVIFFKSGRALVRAKTKSKAKTILSKYIG